MVVKMLLNIFMLVLSLLINDGLSSSLSSPNEVWKSRRIVVRRNATSNSNDTIIAIRDDTMVLECEFHVSGWSSIQWVKFGLEDEHEVRTPTGLPVGSTSTNGSVSVATLLKLSEDDRGRYSCILATLSGISKSYNFQVTVKEKASCHKNTCTLNGLCLETIQGFMCMCNKGFVGANCELMDPCSSLPCYNNGTCTTQGEGFNCSCQAGFDGEVCEREVCSRNICGSGATCKIIDGRRNCTCPYNRAGDRCQYSCSFRSYYCSYTTCLISFRYGRQQEECRCDNNRQGGRYRRCMMLSDVRNECSEPGLCNGRGNCYDQVYGYRCACHSYAHGKNCELYNECSAGSNLCRVNGGTCVDLTVGYKCRNCPDGQTGDKCQYKEHPCKVTCQSTSMIVECDMRFISSKLRNIPIYANSKSESCRFRTAGSYSYNRYDRNRNRLKRMTISYKACGTEIEYHDDSVVYRNRLRAGGSGVAHSNLDTVITREAGHFSFKMECTLPLVRNATGQLIDYSLRLNETADLADSRDIGISGTYITIYKDGNYAGQISSYVVGDRLYAKMTIDDNSNPTLSRGYKLHPVTCFATPDRNGNDEKYVLLEDGCIQDDTFRFENDRAMASHEREAFFSFESFSFKSNPGKLYLHCTSLACINPQTTSNETCDVSCIKTNAINSSGQGNAQPSTATLNSREVAKRSVETYQDQLSLIELMTPRPTVAALLITDQPATVAITRAPGSSVEIFTSLPSVAL